MGRRKAWSKDEIDYLQDRWGSVSIKNIAKHIGRTPNAVQIKAQRMNLRDARTHYDGITVHQLGRSLDVSYSTMKNWIKRYRFPARKKIFAVSGTVLVVCYDDFWEWAERNKHMVNFAKLDPLSIGAEPEWVNQKRKLDHLNNRKNTPWSKEEELRLVAMVESYKYTYPELSREFKRSEGAIKRRLFYLGIKARPLRLCNHTKYTEEEENIIIDMAKEGYSLITIAEKIGKSANGVRGKMERMGYIFKNGTPIGRKISINNKENIVQ